LRLHRASESIAYVAYLPQRLLRYLSKTEAVPNCLSCGGTNVKFSDARYALVELVMLDEAELDYPKLLA
jgi:hypothetical protein